MRFPKVNPKIPLPLTLLGLGLIVAACGSREDNNGPVITVDHTLANGYTSTFRASKPNVPYFDPGWSWQVLYGGDASAQFYSIRDTATITPNITAGSHGTFEVQAYWHGQGSNKITASL